MPSRIANLSPQQLHRRVQARIRQQRKRARDAIAAGRPIPRASRPITSRRLIVFDDTVSSLHTNTTEIRSSLDGARVVHTVTNRFSPHREMPPSWTHDWIHAVFPISEAHIQDRLREVGQVIAEIKLVVRMKKMTDNNTTIHDESCVQSRKAHLPATAAISVETLLHDLDRHVDRLEGSGWIFDRPNQLITVTSEVIPYRGGSYVPLPVSLSNTKAFVNVKSQDDMCFRDASLAALHYHDVPQGHRTEPKTYHKYHEQIKLPREGAVELHEINLIEDLNPDYGWNIYDLHEETGNLEPIHFHQKDRMTIREIDLFLYEEHFVAITDFQRLFKKANGKRCKFCFKNFRAQTEDERQLWKDHQGACNNNRELNISFPPEGSITSFKNYAHKCPKPTAIYADFECYLKKLKTVCSSIVNDSNPKHSWPDSHNTVDQDHNASLTPCDKPRIHLLALAHPF